MAREFPRATELAHTWVASHLPAGGIAIDATAGNGHDTLFLARACGVTGRVFAFDIQSRAIEETRSRIENAELNNVSLWQRCHTRIAETIPADTAQRINAVMFNLGYLPGGDKDCITRTQTTLLAIERCLSLLASGGIMTVAVYPGHSGGAAEAESVVKFVSDLPAPDWQAVHFRPLNQPNRPPELLGIIRRRP